MAPQEPQTPPAHPTFRPPRLLGFGHALTIQAALSDERRPARLPSSEPRMFQTTADTKILAQLTPRPRADAPTAVLLHGLTGDAEAGYVRGAAKKLHERGFGIVRVNARNACSTESNTPTLYHSGLTEDLRAVVNTLSAEGHSRIYLVGFSMGGNVVLKLAGEWGNDAPPQLCGVAAMSPPIELGEASAAINRGFVNGIYQRWFVRRLRALIRRKAKLFPGLYDVSLLKGAHTLRAIDDRFIAPCFGFEDADDYYHRASAARVMEHIRVPTLIVQARDDSIVPSATLERFEPSRPPTMRFLITDHGGHVGFLHRRPLPEGEPDAHWGENRLVEHLVQVEASLPSVHGS